MTETVTVLHLAQRRRIASIVKKARIHGIVTERKKPWAGNENSGLFSASFSTLEHWESRLRWRSWLRCRFFWETLTQLL